MSSSSDSLVGSGSDGDVVAVDTRGLAERLVSYPLYGAIVSVVAYVELVGRGIAFALDDLARYLADVVGALLGVPLSATTSAGTETIAFLGSTGPAGFVVSVAIVGATTVLLVRGLATIAGVIRGIVT